MEKAFIILGLIISSSCNKNNEDKILNLRNTVDSLNIEIVENKKLIDELRDELRYKEGEVSYYGHLLDSCINGK